MSSPTPEATNRRPEFVTLIAIYQFITAGILFLMSCIIPILVFPAIFSYRGGSEEVLFALALATAALAMAIGFGFASIVVGIGLLRMKNWGRLGAIVLGAFALIGFPVWTVVAVLVLVYLTSDEAREAFARKTGERPSSAEDDSAHAERAAYKAEPAPAPDYNPLQDTRAITATASTPSTIQPEGPATIPPDDDTHRIDPIPMPPASDTDQTLEMPADDSAYSSTDEPTIEMPLGQPSDDRPTEEIPIVEADEAPSPPPKRRWVRPPEEAGMDSRILENEKTDGEDENGPQDRQT